jgi:hypothetical protein
VFCNIKVFALEVVVTWKYMNADWNGRVQQKTIEQKAD